MDTVKEYIDFSGNEELWKEVSHMTGLGQSILEEGIQQGMQRGIQQGMQQGMQRGMQQGMQQGIQILILDNIEENIPKERTIKKLQKRFGLTEESSEQYYEKFASEERQR